MNYNFSLADVEKIKSLFDYEIKAIEYNSPPFIIEGTKEKRNKIFYLIENLKNNGNRTNKTRRRELF